MKEHPILFSAPMVRGLLDGSKTQTRRVVKPQPSILAGELLCWKDNALTDDQMAALCPYGKPGDRLWVREKWQAWDCTSVMAKEWEPWDRERRGGLSINEYHAERGNPDGIEYAPTSESIGPWTPSIHMPRWASRITLEITGVRVERLRDISEADALEEGITYNDIPNNGLDPMRARTWFRGLWESINGPGSWDANPWVWVVEFKRVEGGAA